CLFVRYGSGQPSIAPVTLQGPAPVWIWVNEGEQVICRQTTAEEYVPPHDQWGGTETGGFCRSVGSLPDMVQAQGKRSSYCNAGRMLVRRWDFKRTLFWIWTTTTAT